MVDSAIERFFVERKEAWLKKNLKTSMTEDEQLAKQDECEELFALSNWLPKAAKRAGQISISTHPCTFSHPSARKNKNGYVSSIIACAEKRADGFLRTGNLEAQDDALGNAAALDVYKFLTLVMADKKSLLQHIQQETELAQKILAQPGCDSGDMRDGFLKMVEPDSHLITSSKIKQVFFPVGEEGGEQQYHQLSLLTNSGNLFEQRKRIDQMRFSDEVKKARGLKRQNQYMNGGFAEIYGLATIGFGGTKPQNISVLNNQNAGKAHLLLSAPPVLSKRNIRLPKQDFLVENINPWHCKETFEAYHHILKTEYNNIHIREGRDYRIQEYVDLVIQEMYRFRLFFETYKGEISQQLPKYQRQWLLPEFQQYRLENNEWLEPLMEEIVRRFIKSYKKVLGKHAIELGDTEFAAFQKVVDRNKEALR